MLNTQGGTGRDERGTPETNRKRFRALPAALEEALKGLNDKQLDTPYREGDGPCARSSITWRMRT